MKTLDPNSFADAPVEKFEIDLDLGRSIAQRLALGETVSDTFFNGLLAPCSRRAARRHWTPVAIAQRAAELLTQGERCKVLDVGSGVGKFCIVGALTSNAHFVGVERREALVHEARKLCEALNITRVDFLCQNIADIDWGEFDAIYLYNPFQENIDPSAQIDQDFDLNRENYFRFVSITKEKLRQAKPGTRVVTFHGFGGVFPSEYAVKTQEPWGDDYLELWMKHAPSLDSLYYEGPCTD